MNFSWCNLISVFIIQERGILKEANLEKKKLVQSDPSKEVSKVRFGQN